MRRREAYSYGCLMIRLPRPIAEKVMGFGASIPDDCLFTGDSESSGREHDIHITIKYGLKTVDPDEIEKVVEGVEPFSVELGRCGVFHNDECIVLKLAVESKGLMALNNKVCLALDHRDKHVIYRPHVTVAYLNKNHQDPYYYRQFCVDDFKGEVFGVDQLDFTTPKGNRYIIPLNGKRSKVARRVGSAERVAGMIVAKIDVRISPMEHKLELSDGRQMAQMVGRPFDIDRAVAKIKWDTSRLTRMNLKEAMEFIDEKLGVQKLKWNIGRERR